MPRVKPRFSQTNPISKWNEWIHLLTFLAFWGIQSWLRINPTQRLWDIIDIINPFNPFTSHLSIFIPLNSISTCHSSTQRLLYGINDILPSGKRLHNYGKSPSLVGKYTMNHHFNSYVSLPEGIYTHIINNPLTKHWSSSIHCRRSPFNRKKGVDICRSNLINQKNDVHIYVYIYIS